MLTGPVTILQWSFVRDDQPRGDLRQIALAIQDEVLDLEAAGAFAIQVDEAALREGLPLRAATRTTTCAGRSTASGWTVAPARDETQMHTHMCYSEFNEIMDHIARLDADVLSIEASRSGMEVLDALGESTTRTRSARASTTSTRRACRVEDEIERLLELAEERTSAASASG